MSKSAQPTGDGQPVGRAHLRSVDYDQISGWVCAECSLSVTVDPHSGVEYGHARTPRNGGRCPHRPDDLDPDVSAKGGRR